MKLRFAALHTPFSDFSRYIYRVHLVHFDYLEAMPRSMSSLCKLILHALKIFAEWQLRFVRRSIKSRGVIERSLVYICIRNTMYNFS